MSHEEADLPAWRREKIFPLKPDDAPFGAVVEKNQARGFASFEELIKQIENWREPLGLIWTPDRERCFPPEEEARLLKPLRKRKRALAKDDWQANRSRALIFLVPLLYSLWSSWKRGQLGQTQDVGLMAVLWLMFGGIPAYEAWKRGRKLESLTEENLADEAQEVRFEIWLRQQNVPVTKLLLGLLIGVYLVQVLVALGQSNNLLAALWMPNQVLDGQPTLAGLFQAGLVKELYFQQKEWWRLLTAPLLHGGLLHIVMNGLGILYLGRRTEVMARWPHLVLVFLISAICGGLASAHGLLAPTIGASGGALGLLGFLLIFEKLHGRLVPIPATRRLCAGILLTFVVGFVGYSFIDNWAHGGGLLAGMAYAAIVFPKSSSPHRPRATRMDIVFAVVAGLILIAAGLLAVARMRGMG